MSWLNFYKTIHDHNNEPEAAVSEGKEATTIYATTGVVPTICGSSFILDTAQPQPAGTEPPAIGEAGSLDPADYEHLSNYWMGRTGEAERRVYALKVELAALQRSHDACVKALKTINRLTSPGNRTLDDFIRDTNFACDIARAALANAEKLRAAK